MHIGQFKEPALKDKALSHLFVFAALLAIVLGGFFLLEKIGTILYLVVNVFAVIALLILWHSSTRAYKCKNCEFEFQISFFQDLITANSFSQKMLTCPSCNFRGYATELVKEKS